MLTISAWVPTAHTVIALTQTVLQGIWRVREATRGLHALDRRDEGMTYASSLPRALEGPAAQAIRSEAYTLWVDNSKRALAASAQC